MAQTMAKSDNSRLIRQLLTVESVAFSKSVHQLVRLKVSQS